MDCRPGPCLGAFLIRQCVSALFFVQIPPPSAGQAGSHLGVAHVVAVAGHQGKVQKQNLHSPSKLNFVMMQVKSFSISIDD